MTSRLSNKDLLNSLGMTNKEAQIVAKAVLFDMKNEKKGIGKLFKQQNSKWTKNHLNQVYTDLLRNYSKYKLRTDIDEEKQKQYAKIIGKFILYTHLGPKYYKELNTKGK